MFQTAAAHNFIPSRAPSSANCLGKPLLSAGFHLTNGVYTKVNDILEFPQFLPSHIISFSPQSFLFYSPLLRNVFVLSFQQSWLFDYITWRKFFILIVNMHVNCFLRQLLLNEFYCNESLFEKWRVISLIILLILIG